METLGLCINDHLRLLHRKFLGAHVLDALGHRVDNCLGVQHCRWFRAAGSGVGAEGFERR